jgi:hypothetical protein
MKIRKPKTVDQPRFDIGAPRKLAGAQAFARGKDYSPAPLPIGNTDYQPKGGAFRVSRQRIARHS